VSTKRRGTQQRQRLNRRAQAARARRQRSRQRRVIAGVVVAALVGAIVIAAVVASGGGSKDTNVATKGSTTTVAAAKSVAGKPCVPVRDTTPPGAPAVPVKTGPPPKQLVAEDLKVGTGATVNATDTVSVNYIGVSCSTGRIFDSSYSRQQSASFPLSQVIPGWQQGIPGMKVGGQRLLGIPPALAYGKSGQPPTIAPDETLWFVVEVLEAKPA
jgi:peptidylprolyl isomerase